MRVVPDGLTGAIMAVEGISDAVTFLHGPGGCRIRHMVLSSAVMPSDDPLRGFSSPYYYGYSRVPSSYLDEYDYINGAYGKSKEGLGTVSSSSPALVVVIDSPGASLIGDDHGRAISENGMDSIAIHADESLASTPATVGCGRTLARIMDHLDPEREDVREGTVNLLGLSIMDKDWKAARTEMEELLGSMGLEVLCAPGAGSSVEDMVRSVDAEFNVVVCPEMCSGLREWYESRGVPTIMSGAGAPVGLDAVEAWVRTIADVTGRDPSAPLRRIDRCRDTVYEKFIGMRYNALRLRGMTFSAAGTASVVRPLTEWLYSYLAMAPEAVKVDDGADPVQKAALESFLEEKGFGYAWDREPVPSGAVLCEGVTALTMRLSNQCRAGIPIGYSSMGLDDIIPRPVYGVQGAMYILDELLHGARSG